MGIRIHYTIGETIEDDPDTGRLVEELTFLGVIETEPRKCIFCGFPFTTPEDIRSRNAVRANEDFDLACKQCYLENKEV